MDRKEFDKWCNRNIDKLRSDLVRKYPRCRPTIDSDLSDFYCHAVDRIHDIHNVNSYLYGYIYNSHYRYHSNRRAERYGYLGNCSVEVRLMPSIPDIPDDTEEYDTQPDKLLELIEQLPLPEKILYDLYYVQDLTTREIAAMHGISHTGVALQLKKLRQTLKAKL